MTGAMEKIKAKVENVLHKDKDTTHDTTTGTHSTHSMFPPNHQSLAFTNPSRRPYWSPQLACW